MITGRWRRSKIKNGDESVLILYVVVEDVVKEKTKVRKAKKKTKLDKSQANNVDMVCKCINETNILCAEDYKFSVKTVRNIRFAAVCN